MAKKVLILALALATLFVCVAPVFAESTNPAYTIMYVYTDNGKNLNVRSTPYVGDNIIGQAPFGTEIRVKRFLENGWACIVWNLTGEAYVQSRSLQWYYPSPYITPEPTVRPVPTATPYYPDTPASLNAEFRTARTVTPFTISVRPVRSSGWVNMRWAPGLDMEVMGIYYSGARLTVIAETYNWYQVVDPSTGATGFMMKSYTTRVY